MIINWEANTQHNNLSGSKDEYGTITLQIARIHLLFEVLMMILSSLIFFQVTNFGM